MKAFQCDKCGNYFTRERKALEETIPFDGTRGSRTLLVDLLYRCVHTDSRPTAHRVHFCDACVLWLLEEYKQIISAEMATVN